MSCIRRLMRGCLPVASLGLIGGLVASAASSPPPSATGAPDPAGWAAAFDRLEAADRNVARTTFEPAAVIEAVGRDRAAIVAWVRDNTYWVAYQGELKGPAGTLIDRVGSSLDRALLLAELLRMSGYSVRLAHATLSDAAAGDVITAVRLPPPGVLAGSVGPVDAGVASRVTEQVQKLRPVLAPVRPSGGDAAANAARLAAARDHWWVQWEDQGGAWTDADLTVDDGKPARANAAETFPYVISDGAVSLPAQHAHTIEVSLVIEVWDDPHNQLVEKPVLKAPLRPADLLGRRVMLRHHVLKSTAKPLPSASPDSGAIRAAALGAKEWLPALEVGGRRLAKASFSDAGDVTETADLSGAEKVGNANRGMFGGLGGGLAGGGGGGAPPSKSAVVAEWLQYTIRAPGSEKPKVVRREVFDLIGPAARAAGLHTAPTLSDAQRITRALTLAGMTEILATGVSPSPQFVVHTMAADTLGQRSLCLRVASLPDGPDRHAAARLIHPLTPVLQAAYLRRALSPVRDQVCLSGTNVIDFRTRLLEQPDGSIVAETGIDLAVNDVAVLTGDAAVAFDARVAQGIADTAAESLALTGPAPSPQNTLGLLSGPAAPALLIARQPSDGAVASLSLPADVKARMAADMAGGAALALPERLPLATGARVGWWTVQPDGSTVGVMDNGYHSDITEEAFLENDTVIREIGPLDDTFVRTPRGGAFWKQNAKNIVQILGGDPEDIGLVGMVVDLQQMMLEAGIWL